MPIKGLEPVTSRLWQRLANGKKCKASWNTISPFARRHRPSGDDRIESLCYHYSFQILCLLCLIKCFFILLLCVPINTPAKLSIMSLKEPVYISILLSRHLLMLHTTTTTTTFSFNAKQCVNLLDFDTLLLGNQPLEHECTRYNFRGTDWLLLDVIKTRDRGIYSRMASRPEK